MKYKAGSSSKTIEFARVIALALEYGSIKDDKQTHGIPQEGHTEEKIHGEGFGVAGV